MVGIFGPSYDETFTVYTISKAFHTISNVPGRPRFTMGYSPPLFQICC